MAIIKRNKFTQGLSGKFGDIVFRQHKDRTTEEIFYPMMYQNPFMHTTTTGVSASGWLLPVPAKRWPTPRCVPIMQAKQDGRTRAPGLWH
jgi:hypothetical protein